eukprot:15482007-Alexandrium_andersonii.AAC.1
MLLQIACSAGARLPGICTSQGAQSAIRNPPKAHQCCNPPKSAIRHAYNANSLQAFGPGTARAQEWPKT